MVISGLLESRLLEKRLARAASDKSNYFLGFYFVNKGHKWRYLWGGTESAMKRAIKINPKMSSLQYCNSSFKVKVFYILTFPVTGGASSGQCLY